MQDPIVKNIRDLDTSYLLDVLPDVPAWMKHPDSDRVGADLLHCLWFI